MKAATKKKIAQVIKAQNMLHQRLGELMETANIVDVLDDNGWTLDMTVTDGRIVGVGDLTQLVENFQKNKKTS